LPGELGVRPSKTFAGGFSQGAMMSLGVALAIPEKLDGALLLSGRFLPSFVPNHTDDSIAHLPFLVQHGSLDPVLPVEGSRLIRDRLEGFGCPVTYHEYLMGHEISQKSLDDVNGWLMRRIDDSPPSRW